MNPGKSESSGGHDELDFADSCHYVGQQQRYLADPKKARVWVNKLVARRGLASVQANQQLQEAWLQSVGEEFSNRTQVGQLRRGVLEIIVENSTWLQKLKFQEHQILPNLQARQPHFGIQKLRLRVGAIRRSLSS